MSGPVLATMTDDEVLEEIGRRLRALREARRLSQAEAASRSGISRRTLYSAEQGERPNLLTMVRLLRTYGSLDSLDAFIPPPRVSPMEVLRRKRDG